MRTPELLALSIVAVLPAVMPDSAAEADTTSRDKIVVTGEKDQRRATPRYAWSDEPSLVPGIGFEARW